MGISLNKGGKGSKGVDGSKSIIRKRGVDKVIPKEVPEHDPEALAVMVFAMRTSYLVAAADGKISGEEFAALHKAFTTMLEIDITEEQLEGFIEGADAYVSEHGYEGAIEFLAEGQQDPEVRRAAFTLACAVGCADQDVSEEEVQVYAMISEAYGIEEDEANEILNEFIS